MTVIKIVGAQFTVNATPNTVPTNAGAGSNANFGSTFSGYGNSAAGGATMLYIVNTGTGTSTVTIANAGVNTGAITILANNYVYLEKYSFDTVVASNNSTILATPIAKAW